LCGHCSICFVYAFLGSLPSYVMVDAYTNLSADYEVHIRRQ
jgi:hypothetical protein